MSRPLLYIFRGLQASGKTTLAKGWVAEDPAHRARANRDMLRQLLHAGVYLGHDTEKQVVSAEDALIRTLLKSGISVACDDTNLSQSRARQLARIAVEADATYRVWDLSDVPLELCIARDLDRENPVGEDVIRETHERYLSGGRKLASVEVPPVEPVELYVRKPGTPYAIMVDLDGTLCLLNGRGPYDETRVIDDVPNRAVVAAIEAWLPTGNKIVFCSGRSEACRPATEAWLDTYLGRRGWLAQYGCSAPLFMRAVGDTRKDAVIKREIFDAHIRDHYDVVYVLDDRDQVVEMWRSLGLTVFQVAPGDF